MKGMIGFILAGFCALMLHVWIQSERAKPVFLKQPQYLSLQGQMR